MSWTHHRLEARCCACGATGYQIESDDDWGRFEVRWDGFDAQPADAYLVGRQRVDRARPVCKCGSTDIEVLRSPRSANPGDVAQDPGEFFRRVRAIPIPKKP